MRTLNAGKVQAGGGAAGTRASPFSGAPRQREGPGQYLTFISRSGIMASISSPIAPDSAGRSSNRSCPRPCPHSPGRSNANFLPSALAARSEARTSGARKWRHAFRWALRFEEAEGVYEVARSRGRRLPLAGSARAPAPWSVQAPPPASATRTRLLGVGFFHRTAHA